MLGVSACFIDFVSQILAYSKLFFKDLHDTALECKKPILIFKFLPSKQLFFHNILTILTDCSHTTQTKVKEAKSQKVNGGVDLTKYCTLVYLNPQLGQALKTLTHKVRDFTFFTLGCRVLGQSVNRHYFSLFLSKTYLIKLLQWVSHSAMVIKLF